MDRIILSQKLIQLNGNERAGRRHFRVKSENRFLRLANGTGQDPPGRTNEVTNQVTIMCDDLANDDKPISLSLSFSPCYIAGLVLSPTGVGGIQFK